MTGIDVVLPVVEKDLPVLPLCIDSIKSFINTDARFYVIASDEILSKIHADVCPIQESAFEFSVDDVKNRIRHKQQAGWYWQQIAQFYLWDVLPDLDFKLLFVNSDVVFLKNLQLFGDVTIPMNFHLTPHEPYKNFVNKLLPDIKINDQNGCCHYMVYRKDIIAAIKKEVEFTWNMSFWEAFLESIDSNHINGASEFYLYFQYCKDKYPTSYYDKRFSYVDKGDYWNWKDYQKQGYDYAAFHSYMRNGK